MQPLVNSIILHELFLANSAMFTRILCKQCKALIYCNALVYSGHKTDHVMVVL